MAADDRFELERFVDAQANGAYEDMRHVIAAYAT